MPEIDIKNNSRDFHYYIRVQILKRTEKAMHYSNDDEEYEKAKNIYTDLIEAVEGQYASLYTNRGFANFELGLVQEAIHDFKKALLIDPEDILTLDGLKMCLESMSEEVGVVEGSVG